MTAERKPIILPYGGIWPTFDRASARLAPAAAVLGRVTMGQEPFLGGRAAIRADGHYVEISERFHLGAHGTVHIAHDVLATHIGSDVTAEAGAVIHACDVGDRCHIGREAVILDGSKVAEDCAIAAGSVVFPRSVLEAGHLHEGAPAKPVRRLEPGELDRLHAASRAVGVSGRDSRQGAARLRRDGHVFVAANALLRGAIVCQGDNGIWYGCDLDAQEQAIAVGRNTNIQDNTMIVAAREPVEIGACSTIGHNVRMADCSVGDRSLVGIGAVVAPGTRIGDDVLLAAGARTTEGQVLEDNCFYAGSPARKIAALDDKKRTLIALTWPTYCDYARRFDEAQKEFLPDAASGVSAP